MEFSVSEKELSEVIRTNTDLNFSGYKMKESDMFVVSFYLKKSKARSLSLTNCVMTQRALSILTESLSDTSIETLNLSFNVINEDSMAILIETLTMSRIKSLNISGCCRYLALTRFLLFLPDATNLTNINLSSNSFNVYNINSNYYIDSDFPGINVSQKSINPIDQLCAGLRAGYIKRLDLSYCELTDNNVLQLFSTLVDTNCKMVNLTGNELTNTGFSYIATYLPYTRITNLVLQDMRLDYCNVLPLLLILPYTNVKKLSIRNNSLIHYINYLTTVVISNYPTRMLALEVLDIYNTDKNYGHIMNLMEIVHMTNINFIHITESRTKLTGHEMAELRLTIKKINTKRRTTVYDALLDWFPNDISNIITEYHWTELRVDC